MIIYLLILSIIIVTVKYIYDMHQLNLSATLIQIQNPNNIDKEILFKERSPAIIHNLTGKFLDLENITISNLVQNNPGYIIQDNHKNILLSSFEDEKVNQISIFNNSNMIYDFNFDKSLLEINKYLMNQLSCNLKNELSILKGNYFITLMQNKHNCMSFIQLSGNSIFYIFNPKHKDEIQNKSNNEIKKWAFKINMKPGIILSLPPDWYYIYETEGESILITSYFDNYFTWMYNLLR